MKHGLDVLARFKSAAVAGCKAEIMGIGPVSASKKALARANLDIGDIEVIELNEAFASQALASMQDLGMDEGAREPGWRRIGTRPSAWRHRRQDHRQGSIADETRRRKIRPRHPVHRWRPGHRHGAGGRLVDIKKACVIGSGVMGSGIAAQFANAGFPVLLLDIVPEGAEDRNVLAKEALKKAAKADPAPFMSKRAMKLVEPGNIEDDLDKLADVDWIIEVVVEDLAIKQALYEKIEKARKPGSIVSSNTSTLPLAQLTEGMPESFQQAFLITHFFNPPRYLRLLEVIAGPTTSKSALEAAASFGDRMLGKTVIRCKDTPGFIGNRIGVYWMQAAFTEAFDANIPIEEADLAMGRPLGIPKTGIFGLADLVGIDLLPYVAGSLRKALPPDDAFHAIDRDMPRIQAMIEAGYTGRKGKGGFYRLNKTGGARIKEAMDPRDRRVSHRSQASSGRRRCRTSRRSSRALRSRRARVGLGVAGDEQDARLRRLAGR